MASIVELVIPYLKQVLPAGTTFAHDGHANLKATLPVLENWRFAKTATFVFDQGVIDEVMPAYTGGDSGPFERVANYLCTRMSTKFTEWGQNNVQTTWHVDSEALDQ